MKPKKKQTPIEIKAQAKAKELLDLFHNPTKQWNGVEYTTSIGYQTECAIITCNQMIETLSSMKGMAKISKNTFWKRVKEILEDGDNKEV